MESGDGEDAVGRLWLGSGMLILGGALVTCTAATRDLKRKKTQEISR